MKQLAPSRRVGRAMSQISDAGPPGAALPSRSAPSRVHDKLITRPSPWLVATLRTNPEASTLPSEKPHT